MYLVLLFENNQLFYNDFINSCGYICHLTSQGSINLKHFRWTLLFKS